MRVDVRVRLIALTASCALALTLAGCDNKPPENGGSADNGNTGELFTIPADQMAHIQVLTVEPSTLTRILRLTGVVAYDSFHTTPVITQVSGPVSRIAVVPGQRVER